MANLLSQGCGIFLSDKASPEVWTEIGQVMSISGPDGSASEIDVSNLASAAKEFVPGLKDEGSVTLEVSWDHATATNQHSALWDARTNQTQEHCQIRLSDSPQTTMDFQCYVTGFSTSLGVDDKVGASITLRITGAVTIS